MTLDNSNCQLVVYQLVLVTRYGKEIGIENGCGIKNPSNTRVWVVDSYVYPETSEVKEYGGRIYRYAASAHFRTLGTYNTYSEMTADHPEYKHKLGIVNKLCRKLMKHKEEK